MEFKYFNADMTCTMISLACNSNKRVSSIVQKELVARIQDHTSFSGRVLFCLSRKSKSCPSMNSSTVQNLKCKLDEYKAQEKSIKIVGGISISNLTSWNQFQRHQTIAQHAAGREGAESQVT